MIKLVLAGNLIKAFDFLVEAFCPPNNLDEHDPNRRGTRDSKIARDARFFWDAVMFKANIAVGDGEGATIGLWSYFHEYGWSFGRADAELKDLTRTLVTNKSEKKTRQPFDNRRLHRTPLTESKPDELDAQFRQLDNATKGERDVIGSWGGGDDRYIKKMLRRIARGATNSRKRVMNLLLVARFMLDLKGNGEVPKGHAMYEGRDGVCLSTDWFGPIFCPDVEGEPHTGDYDATVTRFFMIGLTLALRRRREGKVDLDGFDPAWRTWKADENSGYKKKLKRMRERSCRRG